MRGADVSCERLSDWLREGFTGHDPPAELQAHLGHCPDCRDRWFDRRIDQALAGFEPEPPGDDMADRLLKAAAEANEPTQAPWPALAAAAVLLLSLAALLPLLSEDRVESTEPVALPATPALDHSPRLVRVLIDTPEQRPRARLTVDLGDRFELEGFTGQRRVEWDTRLVEGRNLLELPVRPLTADSGEIRVSLSYDGAVQQQLRVPIDAG